MRQISALRGLSYAALALGVAFLTVPLAAAQGTALIMVQVDGAPADFVIRKSHGSTTFYFNITFTCSTGGAQGPCSGQLGETDVLLTYAQPDQPYPSGWEVLFGTMPERVKARDTVSVPVRVNLLDDEPEDARFTIALSVGAQPVANPTLDPLLGNQLGQSSSAADRVTVDKVLNFGEQLTSWARAYTWPLLGAGVIILVAGFILIERRRGSLTLSSEAPTQTVQAGRGTSFPIGLSNDSKGDDRVSLSVSNLPPEWTAIVPLSELELRGGERTQMWITIRAPPEAQPGQTLGFTLRAKSVRNQRSAELHLQVSVMGGPMSQPYDVPTPPPAPTMDLGEELVEAQPGGRRRRY